MSSNTSACVGAGFQNLDLQAMMLTNPEGPDEASRGDPRAWPDS